MTVELELLAPARDLETGKAAIAAGADAVFIGGPSFGARAAAGNSVSDIAKLAQYAHRFGCRVHVTLNTLLYDNELDEVQDLIFKLDRAGADALIVQDPAIFSSMEIPPGLELHASTQCNIDSLEKLIYFRSLGFSQAVLPREISLEELQNWSKECPLIRLEVFVGGALCVGQSGICYISEFMTGRSANRGECAQICRLPMDLISPDGSTVKSGHLLSLKDNLSLELLPELILAGATSFKIEGRLKSKEYVANLTAAFSDRLNQVIDILNEVVKGQPAAYARQSKGILERNFTPDPSRTFNRGFTDAYLTGSNENLSNISTPKFVGPRVGRVYACMPDPRGTMVKLRLEPGVVLRNGDGLTYFGPDGELKGFRASSAESRVKGKHARNPLAFVRTEGTLQLQNGTEIFRNYDIGFVKSILAPKALQRRLQLKAQIKFFPRMAVMCYSDELNRSTTGMLPIPNSSRGLSPLSEAVIEEKCRKCADPDFEVTEVLVEDREYACMPISLLNELRRRTMQTYIDNVQEYRANQNVIFMRAPRRVPCPDKTVDSRLVLNAKSRAFYQAENVEIVDYSKSGRRVLMTCRNCLIKNFARCSKDGGKVSGYKLRIGGKLFGIETDCVRCRMKIVEES